MSATVLAWVSGSFWDGLVRLRLALAALPAWVGWVVGMLVVGAVVLALMRAGSEG